MPAAAPDARWCRQRSPRDAGGSPLQDGMTWQTLSSSHVDGHRNLSLRLLDQQRARLLGALREVPQDLALVEPGQAGAEQSRTCKGCFDAPVDADTRRVDRQDAGSTDGGHCTGQRPGPLGHRHIFRSDALHRLQERCLDSGDGLGYSAVTLLTQPKQGDQRRHDRGVACGLPQPRDQLLTPSNHGLARRPDRQRGQPPFGRR
jgi:hypothetical protein